MVWLGFAFARRPNAVVATRVDPIFSPPLWRRLRRRPATFGFQEAADQRTEFGPVFTFETFLLKHE
jgi:hypothetical protein